MTSRDKSEHGSDEQVDARIDRRTLLRRFAAGAAVTGAAWTAPQVVIGSTAFAAGTTPPEGEPFMYIADAKNQRIVTIDSLGTQSELPTSGLNYPRGVAVDTAGNVYIADFFNRRVVEVDSAGVQSDLATLDDLPTGITVDTAGNVFVCLPYADAVVKITPLGATSLVPTSGLDTPEDLALDTAGNLYIADQQNDRIVKIDLGGTQSTVISGVRHPT
ncbi:MAG TPA: hypothetical protein VFN21_09815, partial [Acidimicrobiales bacterium]|nr:hypothetical protein [Acidimicrobiales bacterium]